MKQTFITVILVFSFFTTAFSQTSPQFGFNSVSDYSSITSKGNDYQNYVISHFLVAFANDMSNKEKLQLCYRMYEYEHTSKIVYTTADNEPLPLRASRDTVLFSGKIPVNFGSSLEKNDEEDVEDSVVFALWFASPVTQIDPAIFSATVKNIVFPPVSNLEYRASAFSCVKNLIYLEGEDVVDNRLLINHEGELIVAAVSGLTRFDIPNQVVKIGDGAFRGCTLQEIVFPASVKCIGNNAFDLCDNLASVYIYSSESIQISPSAFYNDKKAKYKIYVPKQCCKEYRKKYPTLKKRIKELKPE